MSQPQTVKIGLLGFGNIGAGLVDLIQQNRQAYLQRTGLDLDVTIALVRDLSKSRLYGGVELTTNPSDIYQFRHVDIVVELMGGLEPARTLVLECLRRGKHVVTANKSLLAWHGKEIFRTAARLKRSVGFEASVCGGIPLIRVLNSGLIANEIDLIYGIVNGTTNYILSKMHQDRLGYKQALAEAQEAGFAEPNPHNDVSGIDAAEKLAVLAGLAFGVDVLPNQIPCQGIERLTLEDIRSAEEMGYVIKMLAYGKQSGRSLDLRVQPTLIPNSHPLANVANENNAVFIHGSAVSDMMLYGKGAGRYPTASAVLSDIVEIARSGFVPSRINDNQYISKLTTQKSRFYIRIDIPDRPGAIGKITTHFGKHKISISHAAADLVKRTGSRGRVTILTHDVSEKRLQKALSEIEQWPDLHSHPLAIRVF